jgi:hypothetical protein
MGNSFVQIRHKKGLIAKSFKGKWLRLDFGIRQRKEAEYGSVSSLISLYFNVFEQTTAPRDFGRLKRVLWIQDLTGDLAVDRYGYYRCNYKSILDGWMAKAIRVKRFEELGLANTLGVLRFAQDDGKNKNKARATATADPYGITNQRTYNGKGRYEETKVSRPEQGTMKVSTAPTERMLFVTAVLDTG